MEKIKSTFLAKIKERYCLNPSSERKTYHLIIDLEGSGIQYSVGDCLGIFPENDPKIVGNLLKQWQLPSDYHISDRQGNVHLLKEFLSAHANLSRIAGLSTLAPIDLCKKLPPLLPRFYSIASAQRVVGNEAHLTVGLIDGTCSQYLCIRAPLNLPILPIFHQPAHHFSLPADSFNKPLIMIGPGTGIAPFRGFIQERLSQKSSAKNWLFFGEKREKHDFYYQSDWQNLIQKGQLQIDCAFSRDQEHKIYVQHKMLEKRNQIWESIQEGAYLFVCGNASHMAKDVDKALHSIIEQNGNLSPLEAKAFVKNLKAQNRYQRDIY